MKPHQRCPKCGRLLVKTSANKFPPHRIPQTGTEYSKTPPLTGLDQPWCEWSGK